MQTPLLIEFSSFLIELEYHVSLSGLHLWFFSRNLPIIVYSWYYRSINQRLAPQHLRRENQIVRI